MVLKFIHSDIIERHILTRLDGHTLATTVAVSKQFHRLSADQNLWRDICTSTWQSCNDPRVQNVISDDHRSFFSDVYPVYLGHESSPDKNPKSPSVLISAVDLVYKNNSVISTVMETDTMTDSFLRSPFSMELLEPKSPSYTRPRKWSDDDVNDLEENLTLSWIVIDPIQNRVMNLSSRKPVSVKRQWWTGEVELKYAIIVTGDLSPTKEMVKFEAVLTVTGIDGESVEVSELNLQVEDMEGKYLSGSDTMKILEGAMSGWKRSTTMDWKRVRERYEMFVAKKTAMTAKLRRKERILDITSKSLDIACLAVGVATFVIFWISFFSK